VGRSWAASVPVGARSSAARRLCERTERRPVRTLSPRPPRPAEWFCKRRANARLGLLGAASRRLGSWSFPT